MKLKRHIVFRAFQTLIVLCISCSCSWSQLNLDSLLQGHYTLNGNALDISGNGLDGTVLGATPTTDRSGIPNFAYAFDGINDQITLPSDPLLKPQIPFSVSIWVKPDNFSQNQRSFFSNNQTPGVHSGINLQFTVNSKTISGGYSTGGGTTPSNRRTIRGSTVLDNNWHHVVLNCMGPTDMELFIDGEKETMTSYSGSGAGPVYYDQFPPSLGTFESSFTLWFLGALDDLRLYSRPLSECEVKYIYNDLTPPEFQDRNLEYCDSSDYSISAPSGYQNYVWKLGNSTISQPTLQLQNLPDTTIQTIVTFEDQFGCQHHQKFEIKNNTRFNPNTPDTIICSKSNYTLIQNVPSSHELQLLNTNSLFQNQTGGYVLFSNNPSFDSIQWLTYPYFTDSKNGSCLFRDTARVGVLPSIQDPVPASDTICPGDSIIVDLSPYFPNLNYQWENRDWSQIRPGRYFLEPQPTDIQDEKLTVINSSGCRDDFFFTPDVEAPVLISLEGDSVFCPQIIQTTYSISAIQDGITLEADSISISQGIIRERNGNNYTVQWEYPRPSASISGIYFSRLGCEDYSTTLRLSNEEDQDCPEYAEELLIPNTITPNGDGFNDEFKILVTRSIFKIELKIFNRWGELIYESQDYKNDWGYESNLEPGIYYYQAKALGLEDELFKGFIQVIR